MSYAGFPGSIGTTTTGYKNIGAVQKQSASNAGFPGAFGTTTTGYRNIGAVQKDVASGVVVVPTRTRRHIFHRSLIPFLLPAFSLLK